MKTHSKQGLRRLLIKMAYCCASYIDQVGQLERAIARKPAKLQIDMVGTDEIPADIALLIRSVLLRRSPATHLVTNARSSLRGASVLVWLMGDTRLIREDAKLFFRKSAAPEEDEDWKDEEPEHLQVDLDEADYAQVLEYVDDFLPVKELAGRLVDVEVLRQFGLIDNDKIDHFLASALGISVESEVQAGEERTLKSPASSGQAE